MTQDDSDMLSISATATLRPTGSGEALDAALMRSRVLARMFDEHDPPPQIDRFELLEELGRGGMGRVYLAYDPRLERKLAIKRLLTDTASEAQSRRMLTEAQALARLAHPNVVQVFEVGHGPAGVWIAMEYVPGQTLTRWLQTPREWREILAMLIAAGRGLAAAHAVELVHRDFKPSNVIVGADGRARVLDFGLVLNVDAITELEREASTLEDQHDATPRRRSAEFTGTPAYMAPESFGEAEVGPHTDQWAFCVTVYEALFGRRPFSGSTITELIERVCEHPPAPIERATQVPANVRAALLRGLAKRPSERWPSMTALLDTLEAQLVRRRFVWPLAAVAIGLGGIAIGLTSLAASDSDPCPRDPAALAGSWDAEVKARVEHRYRESKLPQAEAAARVLVGELERWSGEWEATRHGACVATRIEGLASDALFDARLDCLQRRRHGFDGLLGALLEVTPDELVLRSAELVAALPGLDSCAGRPKQSLPSDPAAARRVLEGHRELERAQARGLFGDIAAATAQIDQLIEAPGLADHPPFVLEARLRRAMLEFDAGRQQQAIDALHAVALEADATDLRELELEARLSLVRVAAEAGRTELGAWLIDEARAGLVILEHDELAAAQLSWAQARLAQHDGDLDAAIAGFERTLELDPRLASREILLDIGNAHAERGELDRARSAYERAQAALLDTWGPHSQSAAKLELALGSVALQAGQLHEARARLDAAETILAAASPGASVHRARIAENFAKLAMNEGDLPEAKRRILQAIELLEAAGELDTAEGSTALMALGVIHYFDGDLDGSLAAYERALAIQQRVFGDAHWRVGWTRSNLGESLLALDRREAAAAQFHDAHAILVRALAPDDARLALPLKGLGLIALADGSFELARERLEQALALVDGDNEPQELADLRFALARALRGASVEPERAAELAELARTGFDALGLADRRDAVAAWLADR
jgi:tetratricopeptide (TPR) repeat protein/tRNA A-37 threonylcarbamoyl transferase component Bud32